MGISPRELLREKGTPYAELGLADPKWSDDELIDFMLAHPILINRPIVVTPKGVRLCRPSELVLDLLDRHLVGRCDFAAKEDGEDGRSTGSRESLKRDALASRSAPSPIARHNGVMELTPRLRLMNWLVSQGLTGLPENDLIRGFCERCRAEGLDVSRGLVFIDTLHPIFEGRGFRWNDAETNESDVFEYGSTDEGEAAQAWRSSIFYHMLENGHEELPIDLADGDRPRFQIDRAISPRKVTSISWPTCTGSARPAPWGRWTASIPTGRPGATRALARRAWRRCATSCRCWGLRSRSAAQADIAKTLGRVYLGRDAAEQVLRGRISRGVTERINAVLWFSDLRGSTAISESIEPGEIIPFLNDYAQASIDAIHDAGGEVLKLIGDGVLAMFTDENMAAAKTRRAARRASLPAQHDARSTPAARPRAGR